MLKQKSSNKIKYINPVPPDIIQYCSAWLVSICNRHLLIADLYGWIANPELKRTDYKSAIAAADFWEYPEEQDVEPLYSQQLVSNIYYEDS